MTLTEEQGGFDLEKARASIAHYRIENPSNVDTESALKELVDQANLAEDALAEIERLRADNAGLSKAVISIQEERDLAQAEFRAYHRAWEEQAARIQELEDALVEGLTNFLHYRASCYDPARRCPYAKECDDCSTWDACGHVEKFRSEARQRLQADGKIGPDARPRSWQITEERMRAIRLSEELAWDCKVVDVLRAMLEGAE